MLTYADLDRLQRQVRESVLKGGPGRLLFAQVAPVVTLGLRDANEHLLLSPEAFFARGIEVYSASRGGCVTYHGPGQWVVFPVESLERLTGDRRGVRKATEGLLAAALEVCRERFPEAEVRGGKETGVWSARGARGGKVVAMGLRFEGGVLQHGLSMNVFRTPESFVGIRPCGLDAPVAYLEDDGFDERRFLEWGAKLERAILKRFPCFSPESRPATLSL